MEMEILVKTEEPSPRFGEKRESSESGMSETVSAKSAHSNNKSDTISEDASLILRCRSSSRLRKCQDKSRELEARISKTLHWIAAAAKEKHPACKHLSQPLLSVEGAAPLCGSKKNLEEEAALALKIELAALQKEIEACINAFIILSTNTVYVIQLLEKYKKLVKTYARSLFKYENGVKGLKIYFSTHKMYQKQKEFPKKGYKRIHTLYQEAFSDYFLFLNGAFFSKYKNLSKIQYLAYDCPVFNMHAINRLSAILKALKYCQDYYIKFNIFQREIQLNANGYLRKLRKSCTKEKDGIKIYPDKKELNYLAQLQEGELYAEVSMLCKLIVESKLGEIESTQEKSLDHQIREIRRANEEMIDNILIKVVQRGKATELDGHMKLILKSETLVSELRRRKRTVACSSAVGTGLGVNGKCPSLRSDL